MAEAALPSDLSKVDPADAWKPWQPAAGAFTRKWAAHLFRRAAFGATEARLQLALKDGPAKTLDVLLAGEPDAADRLELLTETGRYYSDPASLRTWWLYAMLESGHPLREKLSLFWHIHFATSYAKVRSTKLMYEQNVTIRKHALGTFPPFLLEMSKDTAMLVWLDSNRNVKGVPNENFAREVMELFSLGVGNYTEKDIQEAARALTGWHHDVEVSTFVFNRELHDDAPRQRGEGGGASQTAQQVQLHPKPPGEGSFAPSGLLKSLAGPFVPGLRERLDANGISNFKALVFSSGFDGKESRALYELDAPGERKGVAKIFKKEPLGLADLPPLPSDVSRFSALRVDPAATYDAALGLIEFASLNEQFGPEDGKKPIAQQIQERKDFMRREVDKFLGISVGEELMPHLGDKLVIYQSPTEGLSVFGVVFCVSVKDAAKVWAATGRIQSALEGIANSPIKVKKRVVRGVETREFHSRGFGVVTPTYAIVGDWLVVGGNPQLVQGAILRHKGELPKWKPDDATAKRLAGMEPGCGIQFCDPRSTASNLCTIGPLFLGLVSNIAGRFGSGEEDFEPLDVGIIPNAHELTRHLFPNLTVTRDDGKTIRIEVNESFSLPLEVLGVEPLAFGLATIFIR
jgi:hypothetical protein